MALPYRGRFAPSPTGPLHFGSLVAAVGSYLDARTQGGEWLVRMEDVDAPRCSIEAATGILNTLDAFGFEWDGPVVYQQDRRDAYLAALESLKSTGAAYPCACSRKEVADSAVRAAIDGGLAYPGTCRGGLAPGRVPRAWRFRVDDSETGFVDRIQGPLIQCLEHDVGDFVLLRADELFAYQLAVVVDDHEQGVTHVVRGADLLDSTPRQIALMRALRMPVPQYAHLPVVVNAAGEKLSKQTCATAVQAAKGGELLLKALCFLGQAVPPVLTGAPINEVWAWALAHWDFAGIPRQRTIAPTLA